MVAIADNQFSAKHTKIGDSSDTMRKNGKLYRMIQTHPAILQIYLAPTCPTSPSYFQLSRTVNTPAGKRRATDPSSHTKHLSIFPPSERKSRCYVCSRYGKRALCAGYIFFTKSGRLYPRHDVQYKFQEKEGATQVGASLPLNLPTYPPYCTIICPRAWYKRDELPGIAGGGLTLTGRAGGREMGVDDRSGWIKYHRKMGSTQCLTYPVCRSLH